MDLEYTSPALKMHEICLNFRKISEWKFRIVIQKTSISFRYLNMPKLKFFPHCTEYPPQYWCYPPACTEYPPQYWCYPPLYWTTSTVLKVSPTCTAVIPPQYWRYPSTVLNTLHSTVVIPPHVLMLSPHCTEQPRQHWSYPPTVLNSLHSTEAIPPQYWCYPPDVLNNLHSTEPMLYGVINGCVSLAVSISGENVGRLHSALLVQSLVCNFFWLNVW